MTTWVHEADGVPRRSPPVSRGSVLGPNRGRRFQMPAKLFVGNLSFQATEEDLRELFQQAGTVESVRIVTDQFTGRPRGFGFVEMATKEEAAKAVEATGAARRLEAPGQVFRGLLSVL